MKNLECLFYKFRVNYKNDFEKLKNNSNVFIKIGEGAWSAWSYRLIVEDKNGTIIFDYSDIKGNQYTVSSLKAGTEYILKVGAYTFSGEGPWSPEFRGKTLHRNTSLLWSSTDGLLKSDITGYRVTKIDPINYAEVKF